MKPTTKDKWNQAFKNDRKFHVINEEYLLKLLDFTKQKRGGKSIENALDLGCGTGDLLVKLAKSGISATGVDFSDIALGVAKNKIVESEFSEKIKLIEFDLNELDKFDKAERYDIIFSNISYSFINNKDEFLKNAKKLLDNNGVFVLITPILIDEEEYSERLKNISVEKSDVEELLKKEFGSFIIFNKRDFLKEGGSEITYICKK